MSPEASRSSTGTTPSPGDELCETLSQLGLGLLLLIAGELPPGVPSVPRISQDSDGALANVANSATTPTSNHRALSGRTIKRTPNQKPSPLLPLARSRPGPRRPVRAARAPSFPPPPPRRPQASAASAAAPPPPAAAAAAAAAARPWRSAALKRKKLPAPPSLTDELPQFHLSKPQQSDSKTLPFHIISR